MDSIFKEKYSDLKWWWIRFRKDTIFHKIERYFSVRRDIVKVRGIKRGEWWDTDYVLFHSMFSVFCDYVEKELGYMWNSTLKDIKKQLKENVTIDEHPNSIAYAKASWWNRFRNKQYWREQLAIAHLDWEINLINEVIDGYSLEESQDIHRRQSENAVIKKKLYFWYKYERPNRPDPFEFYDHLYPKKDDEEWPGDLTEWFRSEKSIIWVEKVQEMEEQQEKEDEDMMIELVKIRRSCWT